jgi:type IV secretory pathway VirJ component
MDSRFFTGIIFILVLLIIYRKDDQTRSTMATKKRWETFKYNVGLEAKDKTPICNHIDGHCYPVVKDFENQLEASQMLARLNKFCIRVLRHLRQTYIFENQHAPQRQIFVERLLRNYNPDNLVENNPPTTENTSYVDDKGKVFAMCLREKESGASNFHNMHELEFVALHEMTHLGTQSYEHNVEFWSNFKFLLQETNNSGIHIPADYNTKPINYCGLYVDHNPFYDHA